LDDQNEKVKLNKQNKSADWTKNKLSTKISYLQNSKNFKSNKSFTSINKTESKTRQKSLGLDHTCVKSNESKKKDSLKVMQIRPGVGDYTPYTFSSFGEKSNNYKRIKRSKSAWFG